jgi:hypothetical protein
MNATDTYKSTHAACMGQIHQLRQLLAQHAAIAARDPECWAYAGTLRHLTEDLQGMLACIAEDQPASPISPENTSTLWIATSECNPPPHSPVLIYLPALGECHIGMRAWDSAGQRYAWALSSEPAEWLGAAPQMWAPIPYPAIHRAKALLDAEEEAMILHH